MEALFYAIQGRLDGNTAPQTDILLEQACRQYLYLALDFEKCPYLSSAGIRCLIKSQKSLKAKGGSLFLYCVDETIADVLEMSGITGVIPLLPSREDVEDTIKKLQLQNNGAIQIDLEHCKASLSIDKEEIKPLTVWEDWSIASFTELSFSAGWGVVADSPRLEKEEESPFITALSCAGFAHFGEGQEDYRITADPSRTGLFVHKAFTFGAKPIGILEFESQTQISIAKVLSALSKIPQTEPQSLIVWVCKSVNPSISFAFASENGEDFVALKYCLSSWKKPAKEDDITDVIKRNIVMDNVLQLESLPSSSIIDAKTIAIFKASNRISASQGRLQIQYPQDADWDWCKDFLCRRIYTDSASVKIKTLHGGYSARTYQVESFDSSLRRLRPTVMKLASKPMIDRESSRCMQYAFPYIMNNAAQVIGTAFWGSVGALRYNFVGIGGKDAPLQWLTHFYKEKSVEVLEPLFDKIFTRILQPWYGQAVPANILPFAQHDPSLSFFSGLIPTAESFFHISADSPRMQLPEIPCRDFYNPYYFLKHVFPSHRGMEYPYYEAICHGDLNMQNILIDDKLNIFLIDFSETKPRNAVSDFARLEQIMMIENSPCKTEEENKAYMDFIINWFRNLQTLDPSPAPIIPVALESCRTEIEKNIRLSSRMRQYATQTAHGNTDASPYIIAALEWILPIVCYSSADNKTKTLSAVAASVLCESLCNFWNL